MSLLKKIKNSIKKIGGDLKKAGDSLIDACQDAWEALRPLVAVAAFVIGIVLLFIPGGAVASLTYLQWGIILIAGALLLDPEAVFGLVLTLVESIAGLVGSLIGASLSAVGGAVSNSLLPLALVVTAGFVGYKLLENKGEKNVK